MKVIGSKNNSGSILVMAVVLSFVTVLLGVTFLTFAVTLHDTISREIAQSQVLYDAQAGVFAGLADQISGRQPHNELIDFYERNKMGYDIGGEGNEDIDIGTLHQIKIIGLGHSDFEGLSVDKELNVNFSWETYADYLYITNSERDGYRHELIYFWTPDTLDGKVHSNDTIHIMNGNDRPRFMKRVTTTPNCILPPYNHARFDEGKGQRSKIIFPDQATELRLNAGWTEGTGGHDSLTQLGLSHDYVYYRKCGKVHVNGQDKIHCEPPSMGQNYVAIPPSGVIFIYGKTWVSAARGRRDKMDGAYPDSSFYDGDFNSAGFGGQMTIGSADTMIIVDDLIYEPARSNNTVPTTMDSCSDVLGLVSENWIMVGKYVNRTVYINAAMAAVRGSISVQDIYWERNPGWDNEKQSLQIWGSLAQRNRGIVHIERPWGHARGFPEKDYHYDVRLMDNPPPHFMRTGEMKLRFLDDLFAGNDGGGD
jgi:hypothetical protein